MQVFYKKGDPLPEKGIGRDCAPLTDAIYELGKARKFNFRQLASSCIEIFVTIATNGTRKEQEVFLYVLREAQKTILQAQQETKR